MVELTEIGIARCDGRDSAGRFIFKLTKEGRAEYGRHLEIDAWRRSTQ
ncbi:hypothetical protein [Allomesorhizobium alhagi]|uniref:Uncharacterized protein n=1 Tax=Mesorhizobium alhagi CCNWXJ12-2 TaxID=1107882 RepID=H0HR17_9HYPH|nr:hypothetical protein [Mesorhizobium alhagi]EHK56797.1 hypothetical protein MAXJ12_13001 [Mesorhizobium alhagi CCNWXJ12-2]